MKTLVALAAALAEGRTRSTDLVEEALARIADPAGEGARTFLKIYADEARATASFQDKLRALGRAPSPYAGIPVSVKDLFDVAGDVTRAGSRALADAPLASRDAPVVARLRAAGFVIVGRTNMTEFAYSGLGINPHYDTPRNPWDRPAARIPGGSSSGAAVSITDGMAAAALGSDTGGSCRIPAALTGIVGYKPTARRVPLEGVVPLSSSLDSIGPLANSVACCAIIDAIIAGEPVAVPEPLPLRGMHLGLPKSFALDEVDQHVGSTFEKALTRLSRAGVIIDEFDFAELRELADINAKGGFTAAESYAWHRELLERSGALYDPRVRVRILRGTEQSAADYIGLVRARADVIARADRRTAKFDALIMPTVPIVAPRIDELASDEAYTQINLLLLRNPSIANFLDRCAISLPCHAGGTAPVGLSLVCPHGADRRLFAIAAGVERVLGDAK